MIRPCHILKWSCRLVTWLCRVVTCHVVLRFLKGNKGRNDFHLSHGRVVTPIPAYGHVAWLTRLCGHVLDVLLHFDDPPMYFNFKTLFLPCIISSAFTHRSSFSLSLSHTHTHTHTPNNNLSLPVSFSLSLSFSYFSIFLLFLSLETTHNRFTISLLRLASCPTHWPNGSERAEVGGGSSSAAQSLLLVAVDNAWGNCAS